MSKAQITRELPVPPKMLGELDPAFFKPTPEEWTFLRAVISNDDDAVLGKVASAQANAKYPYPCIRWFHFTNLMMSTNPVYTEIVKEGSNDPKSLFLDLGCCMGTDVRKLALDGFPMNRIIACDLRSEFIEAGFDLFDDRKTCDISFFADDIFNLSIEEQVTDNRSTKPSNVPLNEVTKMKDLQGRIKYVYTGALFHLFNEETQTELAERVASLLLVPAEARIGDSPVEGCVIFGRHQGKQPAGILDDEMGRDRYGHDTETWTTMVSLRSDLVTPL